MANAQYEKYIKKYQKTPKGKYIRQRSNAKRRGIEWLLTFEEWWEIWQLSGKWEQRGTSYNNYVMARKHDDGPYAKGNVAIIKQAANSRFSYKRGLKLFREGE